MGEPNQYNFQFSSFRLTDIHFGRNGEVVSKLEKGANIEIAPDIGIGFSIVGGKKVSILLEVQLKKDQTPFNFSIKGQGDFEFQKEITQGKEFEKIVYVNLAAIVYPFLREAIADLTRRLGFTPLLMAPINFIEFYNSTHKKMDEEKKATV